MGKNTTIEWTDHSANAWWGCTHKGPGCLHCYAESIAKRYGFDIWGPNAPRRYIKGFEPLLRRLDREAAAQGVQETVFINDMSDMFEDHSGPVIGGSGKIPVILGKDKRASIGPQDRLTIADLRAEAFKLFDELPNLIFQLLTKRPENILRMWLCPSHQCSDGSCGDCSSVNDNRFNAYRHRPNVWLGTSVACRKDLANIDHLRKCRDLAPVLFLSLEPLIEDLGELDLAGIDWVIIGGESGPGARPFNLEWARSVIEQCRAAGVPVFVKQLGSNIEACDVIDAADYFPGSVRLSAAERPNARVHLKHPKGADPSEWPEWARVREYPQVEVTL